MIESPTGIIVMSAAIAEFAARAIAALHKFMSLGFMDFPGFMVVISVVDRVLLLSR